MLVNPSPRLVPYGNLFRPLDHGSGGGESGYIEGGDGGGTISINAETLEINGTLEAIGDIGGYVYSLGGGLCGGGGSGGAILINATNFKGNGTINAAGGRGSATSWVRGGGGSGEESQSTQ